MLYLFIRLLLLPADRNQGKTNDNI